MTTKRKDGFFDELAQQVQDVQALRAAGATDPEAAKFAELKTQRLFEFVLRHFAMRVLNVHFVRKAAREALKAIQE